MGWISAIKGLVKDVVAEVKKHRKKEKTRIGLSRAELAAERAKNDVALAAKDVTNAAGSVVGKVDSSVSGILKGDGDG
jgi:hypothetical protein